MSADIFFKKGTAAQVASITPEESEPVWRKDDKVLVIGDGVTAGGIPIAMAGSFVPKSLFGAQTILYAAVDSTPVALTVAEQRIVGRKTGGNIAALAGADVLLAMGISATVAELNYVNGVTSAIQTQLDAKVAKSLFDAYSILYADTDDTPAALSVAASRLVGRKASGGIAAMTGAEALALMTTALKAELDLLDLSGLTAGELLVATGAAAAAWQSTGVKLSAPDISGVVTAATALTMPTFVAGGVIDMNGQQLTLDADGDTGIFSTTDDYIEFKVGGVDEFIFQNYSIMTTRHYTGLQSGQYVMRKARGSAGSPVIVSSGDYVFDIVGLGWDGGAWVNCAQIRFEVDTTPGSGDMPGRIVFLTTPDGSSTLAEAMRIDRNKAVSMQGTLSVASNFSITSGYQQLTEVSAPGNPGANQVREYALEDGGGLTDLCAKFQDGTVDVYAQETTPKDSPIFAEPSQTEVKLKVVKLHPGLIQFVAEYPNGKTFVMREIQYHDAEKISANKGCEGSLPDDWEVSTLQERVDEQIGIIEGVLGSLELELSSLASEKKSNANRLKQLIGDELDEEQIKERDDLQNRQLEIPKRIEQAEGEKVELEGKKQLELARMKE